MALTWISSYIRPDRMFRGHDLQKEPLASGHHR